MTSVTTLTRPRAWPVATVAAARALTVTAHTLPPVVLLTTPTPPAGGRGEDGPAAHSQHPTPVLRPCPTPETNGDTP